MALTPQAAAQMLGIVLIECDLENNTVRVTDDTTDLSAEQNN